MADDLIPLGNAIASDIRDQKLPGIMLPIRKNDEPLLLTSWDGGMYGIKLSGRQSYVFFPIKLQSSHEGLFIPEPEILIDLTSAERGVNHLDDSGVLLLERDKLSTVATRAGDGFADPQPVPLWQNVKGGSESAKVAFTRWGVGIREGDKFHILWERKKPVKSTVTFSENT